MTLTVVLLAALAAWLLACRRRARAAAWLGGATVAVFLAVACGPVPAVLCTLLQAPFARTAEPAWSARNAIVVLGGGTVPMPDGTRADAQPGAYPRAVRAVALYRACKQTQARCELILSGGDPKHNGVSEAAVYRRLFATLGVPDADMVLDERSLNTFQNARFTHALLARDPVDRVVLVSSALHLRRALLHFARAGVRATPARADYATARYTLLPNAYDVGLTDAALHEWLGIVAYHVQARLHWNPTLAGANAL